MKVLVISHMYPSTFSAVAGIFVHQQVKELRKQGCDVRVISPMPWTPFPVEYLSSRWRRYSEVPPKMDWDGIEVRYPRYPAFPGRMFFASSGSRTYSGIRKAVAELHRDFQFDIIHAHVALPDGFAGTMVKRDYGKPLVVTIHGEDLYVTIHRNDACWHAIARVFTEADRIVTVSTRLNEIAASRVGFPEKLTVVGNGVDLGVSGTASAELRAIYGGSRIILSASYLIARKGLDFNIRAVSQLTEGHPNIKYLVIGGGSESSYLRRLASNLNLQNCIEFLGELPHNEVMEYMAIADIFSLPSWNEAFGVVYIEAMMHGTPVIACEGEGIADVIEHGKTGLLVKPKDVESLAQAMDYLLSNPEKAQEVGEQARKLVLENYTWEVNARRYIEIYRELLADHG